MRHSYFSIYFIICLQSIVEIIIEVFVVCQDFVRKVNLTLVSRYQFSCQLLVGMSEHLEITSSVRGYISTSTSVPRWLEKSLIVSENQLMALI